MIWYKLPGGRDGPISDDLTRELEEKQTQLLTKKMTRPTMQQFLITANFAKSTLIQLYIKMATQFDAHDL
jgi:hypothetical protein